MPRVGFINILFFVEATVNAFSGVTMIVAPQVVCPSLLGAVTTDPLVLEMIRWFGIMILAFGSLLLFKILKANQWYLSKPVFEAFLLGDLLFTGASIRWSFAQSIWTLGSVFNIVFSGLLLFCRILALRSPVYHGFSSKPFGERKE